MGLDQYAFARKNGEDTLIMQWRKHSNLEGWMADLYHSRGGKGQFNCVELKLSKDDLARLESEFQNLEHASGFFWGQSLPEDDDDTKGFIAMAFKAIEDGCDIILSLIHI